MPDKRKTYSEKRGIVTRMAEDMARPENRRNRRLNAKRYIKKLRLLGLGKFADSAKIKIPPVNQPANALAT